MKTDTDISWKLYKVLWWRVNVEGKDMEPGYIRSLLNSMGEELLQDGASSLYSAAFLVWGRYCRRRNPFLTGVDDARWVRVNLAQTTENLSSYDAYFFLSVLPEFMAGKNVDIPLQMGAAYLFRGCKPDLRLKVENLPATYLRQADEAVALKRCTPGTSTPEETDSGSSVELCRPQETPAEDAPPAAEEPTAAADKAQPAAPAGDPAPSPAPQAAAPALQAPPAEVPGQKEGEALLEEARKQAAEIMLQARRSAAEYLAKTRAQARKILEETRQPETETPAAAAAVELPRVRDALQEVNERMRGIETALQAENDCRVCVRLMELYNLVADARDTCRAQAAKTESGGSQVGDRLEMLLDILENDLEEYGVRTLVTPAGGHWQENTHTVVNAGSGYDPGTAVVRQSLRAGFVRGTQVLQKERVRLG